MVERVGVIEAENPGTYLGIPSMWGKTKIEQMAFIKEKVQGKVEHWKKQVLSQTGRGILIKAVVSAIPTYIMGYFKVPKKCCEEMNSIIAKFWWGQRGKEEKVYWKSWKMMTKAKVEGVWDLRSLRYSIKHY